MAVNSDLTFLILFVLSSTGRFLTAELSPTNRETLIPAAISRLVNKFSVRFRSFSNPGITLSMAVMQLKY